MTLKHVSLAEEDNFIYFYRPIFMVRRRKNFCFPLNHLKHWYIVRPPRTVQPFSLDHLKCSVNLLTSFNKMLRLQQAKVPACNSWEGEEAIQQ